VAVKGGCDSSEAPPSTLGGATMEA
jgi:hypothetical protein